MSTTPAAPASLPPLLLLLALLRFSLFFAGWLPGRLAAWMMSSRGLARGAAAQEERRTFGRWLGTTQEHKDRARLEVVV